MKSLFIALSLALLLSGCEHVMQADVTQFASQAPPIGKNFVVVAEQQQSGSLEFQYYAGLVGGALQDHGFVAAPPGVKSDLVVLIHYGSMGHHTEIYGDPYYWGYGGWGWRRGFGPPFGPQVESKTYFPKELEVEILDGAAWRNNIRTMIYQGRAIGDSASNEISTAVPSLVKALFLHFPGNNGGTERIEVPISPEAKTVKAAT
jgi:hypothetical protein